MIKALIFDWGNTIMRDFPESSGAMAYWETVAWIPGAEEALKELQWQYICCIATGALHSDTAEMKKALKRVGADEYFDYYFSSRDMGVEKSNKEYYDIICKTINLEPAACVMIGDSYDRDILVAKETGIKTILFKEQQIEKEYKEADYVINSMRELIITINKFK